MTPPPARVSKGPAEGVPAAAPDPALPTAAAVVGLVVCCLVSVLSAVVEVFFVPFYVGQYVFPVTVLAAIVINFVLPRLVRIIVTDWLWAVSLPGICWLVVVAALSYANTGRGSVLVPGYGQGQYVALALLFGGVAAAVVGIVLERSRMVRRF